jgi:hypothetical protein
MNEPRRLREDCESNLERALLDAGASYRSTAKMQAKTLAALGLAGGAALSAGTASGLSSVGKLGWAKLVTALSVGAVAAVPAGYYAWERLRPAAEPPVSAAITIAAGQARPANPAKSTLIASPESSIEEPLAAAAPTAVRTTGMLPAAKTDGRVVSGTAALTSEVTALDAARAELANGNPKGALALLDDYTRTYPRGRLELEGDVLRMDALAKSGQPDAARKRAEVFLRRHPKSVLASRVRSYLAD